MEAEQMNAEILHDFAPRFRVYKDGRVERLRKDAYDVVPPSFDPKTNVSSKDVDISPGLTARIYRPGSSTCHDDGNAKLPLVVYFHGGAFCQYSASSPIYHTFLSSLVSEAGCIAVSVNYRLAPEHPMPACYEDSWAATRWVLSHSSGSGPDDWINAWADFGRVFLAGDSAGANISQDIASRAGPGVFEGAAILHPYFGDGKPYELLDFLYPTATGPLDPRMNPAADPGRMRRACGALGRVVVCVAGKDPLRGAGVKYYEVLREGQEKGEWRGELELMEDKESDHVFFLYEPESVEAVEFVRRVAHFVTKSS